MTALTYIWTYLCITAVANGVVRAEAGEYHFTRDVFLLSVSFGVYFINLIILYSEGLKEAVEPVSFKFLAVNDMYGNRHIVHDLLDRKDIFTFGYDYYALLMCALTSVIFSLVYLHAILHKDIQEKKLYLILLLLVQVSTTGAFLSLNLLGFFVLFEAGLLAMAFIIGYWGSSDKR